MQLYLKAAKAGSSYAQRNLGYLHEYGVDTGKDPYKALQWYRLAAAQNDSIAVSAITRIQAQLSAGKNTINPFNCCMSTQFKMSNINQ